jgi:hypothetical protein
MPEPEPARLPFDPGCMTERQSNALLHIIDGRGGMATIASYYELVRSRVVALREGIQTPINSSQEFRHPGIRGNQEFRHPGIQEFRHPLTHRSEQSARAAGLADPKGSETERRGSDQST